MEVMPVSGDMVSMIKNLECFTKSMVLFSAHKWSIEHIDASGLLLWVWGLYKLSCAFFNANRRTDITIYILSSTCHSSSEECTYTLRYPPIGWFIDRDYTTRLQQPDWTASHAASYMYNSFKPPNRDAFRSAGLHAEDLGDRIYIFSRYPKNGTCQPGGRVSRTVILFEIMQVATIRTGRDFSSDGFGYFAYACS